MKEPRTTLSDFEYFKRECRRAQRKFGLTAWRIDYEHTRIGSMNAADANTNAMNHAALIRLGHAWVRQRPPTRSNLRDTARHEMIHVLLAPLANLASARYVTEDEVTHACEEVCRAVHHAIYGKGEE